MKTKTMRSPFTGGEAVLVQETRTVTFRKETFSYNHLCYQCVDTKEMFTTAQMDAANANQIYSQYRMKYGIPFSDEIRSTRGMYALPASKMSLILGFGENQYRLYENGDIPNVGNGRVLRSIQNPVVFEAFVEEARNMLADAEYRKIKKKIEEVKTKTSDGVVWSMVFGKFCRSSFNGFTPQSLSKLKNMMLFFIERTGGVFTTMMNKLLFYSDFLSYRSLGVGMSGLAYKAIQFGPAPEHWDKIYSLVDDISQEEVECANGNVGVRLTSKMPYDNSCFTDEQRSVLETVCATFKNDTPTSISKRSHNEDGWKDNEREHTLIDYKYAFALNEV